MSDNKNLVKISEITPKQIAGICDHTFLNRPESYRENNNHPIKEWKNKFNDFLIKSINFPVNPYAICVRPETIKYANEFLKDAHKKNIKIVSVVGFPHGNFYSLSWKLKETELALKNEITEIDYVIDYSALKKGKLKAVEYEMCKINQMNKSCGVLTKAILETSELNNDEIKKVCLIAERGGIDFVKTSSGFTDAGAKPKHLKIMRENFSKGVKASGGVTLENVRELLSAASGRKDGYIDLNPSKIRIGESSLLTKLFYDSKEKGSY